MCVPRVGTLLAEKLNRVGGELGVHQRFLASLAMENGDGDAPCPLARDAPVGTRGHHVGDALLARPGQPLYFLDLIQCTLAHVGVVNVYKPLVAGAEYDGVVAAPAMRVGVGEPAGLAGERPM